MEIIDELEPHRRGPYGGAVGYVDFSGNMDTCIALRTMVLKGQTAYLQAGAGIVADSVPETEREETLNKAMGLLRRPGDCGDAAVTAICNTTHRSHKTDTRPRQSLPSFKMVKLAKHSRMFLWQGCAAATIAVSVTVTKTNEATIPAEVLRLLSQTAIRKSF